MRKETEMAHGLDGATDAGTVRGFAIVGDDGVRIMGTPFPPPVACKEDERNMFKRAKESGGDVLLHKDMVAVFKMLDDLCIFLYAPLQENELLLAAALDAFYSAALRITKAPLTRKAVLKHYDQLFLLLDCFLYKNTILCDSAEDLYHHVMKRSFEGLEAIAIPSKFSSVFKKAQKSFKNTWLG